MSRSDKEQQMMEDRGWQYEEGEPAIKVDRGHEIGREGDEVWHADLAEVRELL